MKVVIFISVYFIGDNTKSRAKGGDLAASIGSKGFFFLRRVGSVT